MKKFYVGIKGVIVNDGKVLLLRTNDSDGRGSRWECPGGRIDGEESVTEALTRELQEEIPSIKNIEIHELLSAYRLQKDIVEDTSLFLVFYRVTADFPAEIHLSEEHVDIGWFSLKEALEMLEDATKEAISVLEGQNIDVA